MLRPNRHVALPILASTDPATIARTLDRMADYQSKGAGSRAQCNTTIRDCPPKAHRDQRTSSRPNSTSSRTADETDTRLRRA
jgi:hypothetical protein